MIETFNAYYEYGSSEPSGLYVEARLHFLRIEINDREEYCSGKKKTKKEDGED